MASNRFESFLVHIAHELLISIRPSAAVIRTEPPPGAANVIPGRLRQAVYLGEWLDCQVECNGELVRARTDPSLELYPDQPVYLTIEPAHCIAMRLERTA